MPRESLCAACTLRRPSPQFCAVSAPAYHKAARGEVVTDCASYQGRDGERTLHENGRDRAER